MIEKFIYLAIFLAGLALAVHTMLHGAERWRRRSGKPSAAFNPPTVAAMATGFGACGYLLVTRTTLGTGLTAGISAIVSAASFAGMTLLMAKWALRGHGGDISSGEEDVNGQVATVSRTITPSDIGEVTYFAWGARHVLPARSLDGSAIPEGTEVVIDVVENGVAQVELWSIVEQRL